jgi:hypothetical protein
MVRQRGGRRIATKAVGRLRGGVGSACADMSTVDLSTLGRDGDRKIVAGKRGNHYGFAISALVRAAIGDVVVVVIASDAERQGWLACQIYFRGRSDSAERPLRFLRFLRRGVGPDLTDKRSQRPLSQFCQVQCDCSFLHFARGAPLLLARAAITPMRLRAFQRNARTLQFHASPIGEVFAIRFGLDRLSLGLTSTPFADGSACERCAPPNLHWSGEVAASDKLADVLRMERHYRPQFGEEDETFILECRRPRRS